MVLVAAGEFTMGSDADADESKPAHKVTLPAFYIDKTEVTNAEYKAFCDAAKKDYPPNPHLEKDYFIKRPNAPAVGVSFADAKAYADWAGNACRPKKSGKKPRRGTNRRKRNAPFRGAMIFKKAMSRSACLRFPMSASFPAARVRAVRWIWRAMCWNGWTLFFNRIRTGQRPILNSARKIASCAAVISNRNQLTV